MSSIWFTSDTHYGHKNIVRGTSDWEEKSRCRNFDTMEEHNEALVNNINKVVKADDTLYHLGDWSFGGKEQIYNFRKQINCKNINLILGNHDQWLEKKTVRVQDGNFTEYYSDLFQIVSPYLEVKYAGEHFILSHYAMRVWNKSHKGSYHLYAHSHASLENNPYGKSMDVGIDNAYRLLNEYRPFHLNEIVEILNKRKILLIDHHNENTN